MNLAQTIFSLSPAQRKSFIEDRSNHIQVPGQINDELNGSYKISQVINEFISPYFELRSKAMGNNKVHNRIKDICKKYTSELIDVLKQANLDNPEEFIREKKDKPPRNLFELLGFFESSFFQRKERKISEKIGHLWEKLAACSHNAIDIEEEFNMKLVEVDLIINWDGIYYCQLKTKGDTLTGSQVPRTLTSLQLYDRSIFAVAIHTNNFPFSEERAHNFNVTRLKGNEFWSILGIDYEQLLQEIKRIFVKII